MIPCPFSCSPAVPVHGNMHGNGHGRGRARSKV